FLWQGVVQHTAGPASPQARENARWDAPTGAARGWAWAKAAEASSPRCAAEVANSPESDWGHPQGARGSPWKRVRHLATDPAALNVTWPGHAGKPLPWGTTASTAGHREDRR